MAISVLGQLDAAYRWGDGLVCGPCAWVLAYNDGIQLAAVDLAGDVNAWRCRRCHTAYRRRRRGEPRRY